MKRGLVCLSITAALFSGVAVVSADSRGACETGSRCVKQQVDVRHGRAGDSQVATQKEVKLVPAGSAATVAMGVEEARQISLSGGRQTR